MTQDVDSARIANATTEPEAHDEIEITSEMMEAGARILLDACGYSVGDSTAELVARDIFLTMLSASA